MTNWLRQSGDQLKADLERIEALRQRDMDMYWDFVHENYKKRRKRIRRQKDEFDRETAGRLEYRAD